MKKITTFAVLCSAMTWPAFEEDCVPPWQTPRSSPIGRFIDHYFFYFFNTLQSYYHYKDSWSKGWKTGTLSPWQLELTTERGPRLSRKLVTWLGIHRNTLLPVSNGERGKSPKSNHWSFFCFYFLNSFFVFLFCIFLCMYDEQRERCMGCWCCFIISIYIFLNCDIFLSLLVLFLGKMWCVLKHCWWDSTCTPSSVQHKTRSRAQAVGWLYCVVVFF